LLGIVANYEWVDDHTGCDNWTLTSSGIVTRYFSLTFTVVPMCHLPCESITVLLSLSAYRDLHGFVERRPTRMLATLGVAQQ
jgi:hypothetical protein